MIHLILFIILISAVVRLATAPFRYGRYGYRRRHSRLCTILALVALDRLFDRRW